MKKSNYTDYLILFCILAIMVLTWEMVYYGNKNIEDNHNLIIKVDSLNESLEQIPNTQRRIGINQEQINDKLGRMSDDIDIIKRRQEKQ